MEEGVKILQSWIRNVGLGGRPVNFQLVTEIDGLCGVVRRQARRLSEYVYALQLGSRSPLLLFRLE